MSLPYFAMYPTDFDADTGHLSMAEDGAYNRLLRLSWRCPEAKLPDDLDWICRKARAVTDADRAVVQSILAEFFQRKGGKIFSARLHQEWVKAHEGHNRRVLSGKAGGEAKARKAKENSPSNATAMPEQCSSNQNQNHNHTVLSIDRTTNALSGFDEFWNAYPHRDGKRGRKPAEARFAAAVKRGVDPQEIIAGAMRARNDPRVIAGYARDPTTWLNQAGWQDEIDPPKPEPRGGYSPEEQARRKAALEAMLAKAKMQ